MYKRQAEAFEVEIAVGIGVAAQQQAVCILIRRLKRMFRRCLLYTSDAADERSSVDLGGRRIIKKKTKYTRRGETASHVEACTSCTVTTTVQRDEMKGTNE